MSEVQKFVESRVPRLARVESLDEWRAESATLRNRVLDEVVFRGEAVVWRDPPTRFERDETIDGGDGYRIHKLRYEAVPGLWIPALLYEPTELSGRRPVVLNVNGHDGQGKAAAYKQIRCINQAKRGMIALNVEWLGMGQLRGPEFGHYTMNQLDMCGTSGIAPFFLAMKRGIDVLLAHPNADSSRVAVAGLSGGGWQTIFISSLDTRVTLANPVAGYSSFLTRSRHFKDLGDSEQTPCDLATVVDYTHLTAMLAPRAALLTFNSKDNCCFESGYALPPLHDAARPIYDLFEKPDRLRTHVNDDPGDHNFGRDNRQALYRMIGDHFYTGDPFDANEIECESEVKSADELFVPLPEPNGSLHGLAEQIRVALPRDSAMPTSRESADAWRLARKGRLAKLVSAHEYTCEAAEAFAEEKDGVAIRGWRLSIGEDWTIPAVEFTPVDPQGTTIVVSEQGRAARAADVAKLVAAGQRVLAVDPFYYGESKISQRDFLFALLVATVGERPLGVQASQLRAVGQWLRGRDGESEVSTTLAAFGPRSSLVALSAAALPGKQEGVAESGSPLFDRVELHESLASLHDVIEKNRGVNEMPEMFCFGLLESFDLVQIAATAAPTRVTLHDADDRTRAAWQPLADWYKLLETDHNPLP